MLLNRPDQFLPFLAEPVDPLRKTWNVITILFELSVWHIDDRLPGMRMQDIETGDGEYIAHRPYRNKCIRRPEADCFRTGNYLMNLSGDMGDSASVLRYLTWLNATAWTGRVRMKPPHTLSLRP